MKFPACSVRLAGLAAGLLLFSAATTAAAAEIPVVPPDAETWTARPGPWGVLRCTRIRLRPLPEVLDRTSFPEAGTWTFNGFDWKQVDALLRDVALTPAQLAELADPRHRAVAADGITPVLRPSPALRRELSPDSRTRLYDRLAAFESNLLHALPFVLRRDAALGRAGLNPALRAALEDLAFHRGQRRCIVDADLLVPLAADAAELQRLKRLLFTTPAVAVELDRESLARREEVAAYWTAPGGTPTGDFLRLFDGSPGLRTVDLAHLLPPLPRRLLNSYPGGIDSPPDSNCFWLALNFFNPRPDPRYLAGAGLHLRRDDEEWIALERDYQPVAPPYRFGDVLGLFAESGRTAELVHMMVYVADDIVLTKNGSTPTNPFALMRLGDVEDYYAWVSALTVRGFRLRPARAP